MYLDKYLPTTSPVKLQDIINNFFLYLHNLFVLFDSLSTVSSAFMNTANVPGYTPHRNSSSDRREI